MWQDRDKTLALHYGAIQRPDAARPNRVTRLLEPDNGRLILVYDDDIRVGTHPAQVLEDCEAIFGPGGPLAP